MDSGTQAPAARPVVKHVIVETISNDQQRYDTTGDWVWVPKRGTLYIYVSDSGDWRANMAVALHEQTEALLCIDRGIAQQEVEAWDLAHPASDDPGSEDGAPYGPEHEVGNEVEQLFISEVMPSRRYNRIFQGMPERTGPVKEIDEAVTDLSQEPVYDCDHPVGLAAAVHGCSS